MHIREEANSVVMFETFWNYCFVSFVLMKRTTEFRLFLHPPSPPSCSRALLAASEIRCVILMRQYIFILWLVIVVVADVLLSDLLFNHAH
jgi:hypothetical protein